MNAHARPIAWIAATLVAAAGGCNQASNSGGDSEMDAVAARVKQSQQAAADAAAKAAPPPAPPVVQPEPTPPRVAVTPATTNNATSVTNTVKNPQQPSNAARVSADPAHKISHVKSGGNRTGTLGKRKYRNDVDGPLRYYGAMANVRVLAEDRAIGWQIAKSMEVYLAEHDNKYPKDLDEYMRVIIEPNMIQLPELKGDEEFYYDPKDHELKIVQWVEKPAAEGEETADANGAQAAPTQ